MRVPAAGAMTAQPMLPLTLQGLEERRRTAATQLLGGSSAVAYTIITAGTIKPTAALCTVDTEGAASSDDLTNITGEPDITATGFPGHGVVILRAANTARTVVVKHLAGGSYDMELHGSADFSLDDDAKRIVLELRGTRWYEVDRFYAADSAARRTALGLTLLATLAAPANPGDNGKLVTASGGAWVYSAPPAGGSGFLQRIRYYAGASRNYTSGSVIRIEEIDLFTGGTLGDGYVFNVPNGSTFAQLEVLARVERQNENSSHDFAELRIAYRSGSGPFDDTGLGGVARGLPSRSYLYATTAESQRLKEANLCLAAGVVPVTYQSQIRVQVAGLAGNTYRVLGSRTKCWLSVQWM